MYVKEKCLPLLKKLLAYLGFFSFSCPVDLPFSFILESFIQGAKLPALRSRREGIFPKSFSDVPVSWLSVSLDKGKESKARWTNLSGCNFLYT